MKPFNFLRRSATLISRSISGKGQSSRSGIPMNNDHIFFPTLTSFQVEEQDFPPPYTFAPLAATGKETSSDSPYAYLGDFDTILLIDDSGSMAGGSWREVATVLETIAPICTVWDADGIDIHFLNKPDNKEFGNVTSAAAVQRIFREVEPHGATPIGRRLHAILSPYIKNVRSCTYSKNELPKPMNIIVITDGIPTDDPESVIVRAARELDILEAPSWQVGIQFFQVGGDLAATSALVELGDSLEKIYHIRDMVDTVAWKDGERLDGEFVLKVGPRSCLIHL